MMMTADNENIYVMKTYYLIFNWTWKFKVLQIMFLLTLSTPVRKRFDLFTTLLKTKIHRYTYTFQYSSRYSTFVQVAARKTL